MAKIEFRLMNDDKVVEYFEVDETDIASTSVAVKAQIEACEKLCSHVEFRIASDWEWYCDND